ncbi:MAG: twin-arginine translocase TatA/TatE family subunit [Prevotellaceae bacterium]|nr:twin-arginine translocase TatA/TatE family subunit [Prevotellaceae bacterium]
MKTFLFLGGLGAPEIIIIALVVLLLFGGKKIPELMRGIGKGVKSFKDGVQGIESDINASLEEPSKPTTNSSVTEKITESAEK